jgi:hypothetical protein
LQYLVCRVRQTESCSKSDLCIWKGLRPPIRNHQSPQPDGCGDCHSPRCRKQKPAELRICCDLRRGDSSSPQVRTDQASDTKRGCRRGQSEQYLAGC